MRRATVDRAVLALCMVPLAVLGIEALAVGLGANPIDTVMDRTGAWALKFLLLTLAVTPMRRITGATWMARHRRTLGLTAFFYASLHLTTYVVLDQFFSVAHIVQDVMRRPFITVGVATFLLLVALAVTSSAGMMRRLGGLWWRRLHRLTYVAASGAVLHYWWVVRADMLWPRIYAAILGTLLLARVVWAVRSRQAGVGTRTSGRPAVSGNSSLPPNLGWGERDC
jgi:methionine sulfoxide reductase heme-binding subunit